MDEGFLGFHTSKQALTYMGFSGTSQPFIFIDPLCWPWIEQVEGSYPYLRSLGYYVDPHLLYKSQVKFQCVLLVQQTDLLSFYSHQIYLCPKISTVGWAPWNLSFWNSNLMIPDFPIDIRIRLAELKNFFVASWLC